MGMSRTSFQGLSQQSLRYLSNNSLAVQKLQKQLASGKTFTDMSDSPLEAMKVLDLRTILTSDTQYKNNIETLLLMPSAMSVQEEKIGRVAEELDFRFLMK